MESKMKVLRNSNEYRTWFYEIYPCDIFEEHEVELWLQDEHPSEYPCIVYELPKQKHEIIPRTMFISLQEIEQWCHLLRPPKL